MSSLILYAILYLCVCVSATVYVVAYRDNVSESSSVISGHKLNYASSHCADSRQKQREKVTAVRERWGRDGEREGEGEGEREGERG